jgi:heat shock protein HslJ
MRRWGVGITVLGLLGGCGSVDPATDPAGLVGITWVLDADSMASLATDLPPGARADVTFETDEAHGTSGCNLYGMEYEAETDGSIAFEGGAMTEMACDEPRMALEAAFMDAMGAVTAFRIDGDRLELTGGPTPLTFVEEVPMGPLALEGTAWTLDSIGHDGAVSSVLAGSEVTLRLEEGVANGSAGCNTFNGDYESSGDTLTFGPLASTKMACEQGVMDQEAQVLAALGEVTSWSVEEDRLTLSGEGGDLLLGYLGS